MKVVTKSLIAIGANTTTFECYMPLLITFCDYVWYFAKVLLMYNKQHWHSELARAHEITSRNYLGLELELHEFGILKENGLLIKTYSFATRCTLILVNFSIKTTKTVILPILVIFASLITFWSKVKIRSCLF